jgi:hypothetical protein
MPVEFHELDPVRCLAIEQLGRIAGPVVALGAKEEALA